MNLNIEKGTINDIDELEELYNALNDYLDKGINYPGWKKGVYPVRKNASDAIQQGNLFVAKYLGRIVGSLILSHKPEEAYTNACWQIECDYSEVLVIYTFVVHPNYHNCGVGKALLEFAKEYGIQTKIKAIRLDVYECNLPAIKLYEKDGFQYISTVDLGLGSYGLPWFKLYEKLI